MAIRNSAPIPFVPRGLSDTADSTNTPPHGQTPDPPGDCELLQNLIPDPATPNTFQCRPAATTPTRFGGFTGPIGTPHTALTVGTRIYGLVPTGRNSGHDEPFVYDTATNAFVTVTGTINNTTTPVTPALTGAWTPPTMALVGTKILITHPNAPGGAGAFFYWFDITTPATPAWNAGNTTMTVLPGVPQAVFNFNNRAWFAVKNQAWYSDALTPTVITAGTQFLTIGDSTAILAYGPLPLQTTAQGVLAGLLAFKDGSIWQITGDITSTANPLAQNNLSVTVGCSAPRSIASTPLGVGFMAGDGYRMIDLSGQVVDPLLDVRQPFIMASVPSRAAAAYNNGVLRIALQTQAILGDPFVDYWYDFKTLAWNGPHPCAYRMIVPLGDATFIIGSDSINGASATGKLWQSDVQQPATPTPVAYTENGLAMRWIMRSSTLPDEKKMAMKAMIETTFNTSFAGGASIYYFRATDDAGSTIDQVTFIPSQIVSTWGLFVWGVGMWSGSGLSTYNVNWSKPVVFKKLKIEVQSTAYSGLKIGTIYMRWQLLGYKNVQG